MYIPVIYTCYMYRQRSICFLVGGASHRGAESPPPGRAPAPPASRRCRRRIPANRRRRRRTPAAAGQAGWVRRAGNCINHISTHDCMIESKIYVLRNMVSLSPPPPPPLLCLSPLYVLTNLGGWEIHVVANCGCEPSGRRIRHLIYLSIYLPIYLSIYLSILYIAR
jgi:hypothetical protein